VDSDGVQVILKLILFGNLGADIVDSKVVINVLKKKVTYVHAAADILLNSGRGRVFDNDERTVI
jgi:hypothetical protein